MQLNIKYFLFLLCLLQTLMPEALVWAQDAEPTTSVEQATQLISIEEGLTAKPNSFKNLASSETIGEQTTTTSSINNCENNTSVENLEACDCECKNKDQSKDASAEVTTAATIEELTTPASSAETTDPPAVDNSPEAADSSSPNENETDQSSTFVCEKAGNFPHPTDCRRYFICVPIAGSIDFEARENVCTADQAFNTVFSSCMRDLSFCSLEHGGFECLEAGSFADPQSNTNSSYYRCVARLGEQTSPTFHVFHVNCGPGKIFMPQLGKCFFDLNALQTGFNANEFNGMPDDEQLVKAELKQWKLIEKTKLKEEKLKIKYEKKLQKELAKKASKEAKEKAKKEEKAKKGKNDYYGDYD